jgi:propanediol dehydratase small subunit
VSGRNVVTDDPGSLPHALNTASAATPTGKRVKRIRNTPFNLDRPEGLNTAGRTKRVVELTAKSVLATWFRP